MEIEGIAIEPEVFGGLVCELIQTNLVDRSTYKIKLRAKIKSPVKGLFTFVYHFRVSSTTQTNSMGTSVAASRSIPSFSTRGFDHW